MRILVAIGASLAIAGAGCVQRLERKLTADIRTVDAEAPYLKAHMANGDVYVLTSWSVTTGQPAAVIGTGQLMGVDRAVIQNGTFRIAVSDVQLFETNEVSTSPSVTALAVISVVTVGVAVACVANPKACFGSCPTFYAPAEDGRPALQAEGFSDSIAPALEASDIDALWRTAAAGSSLTLRMTNEAYETHVVKQANLLAVPRPRGGRVFSTGEAFWQASAIAAPTACRADEGDCTAAVAKVDGVERTSTTDPRDLDARETIELDFATARDAKRLGVAIATRQTLVTTFLLYQGLAWLGGDATAWLAHAGQGTAPQRARHLLGGIEVQIPDDGGDGWRTVGEVYETGPIAVDVHLVVLPDGARGDRIRLRLPRGGWRVDAVMLAALGDEVAPMRIAPSEIRGTLSRDYGAGRTAATAFPIVTVPGDAYALTYRFPGGDGAGYELFLDSRGYYLEWMRAEWMHEANPLQALRMLADPGAMLRELAPRFKQLEPHMEEIFWRSRYAHP